MQPYLELVLQIFAAQGVTAILLVEYALRRCSRMIKIDEERDSKFPAFRRTDVQKWSRWKFFPVAVLTMFPRIILEIALLLLGSLIIFVATCTHDFSKGPLP